MSHALTKMQGVPSGNLPNTGSDSEISQNQSRPNRPTSRFGFSHQRNTQNTIPATAKATFKEIDEAFAASGKDAAEKKAGKLRPPNFWCSCGNVEPIRWLIIFWLKWHFWGFTVYTIVSDATIFLLGRQTPEQEHELVTQSLVVSPFFANKNPHVYEWKNPHVHTGNTGKTPHVSRSNLHCLIPIFAAEFLSPGHGH